MKHPPVLCYLVAISHQLPLPWYACSHTAHSENCWGWKGPLEMTWTHLLLQACSAGAGCPRISPAGFWISPQPDTPKLCWATCADISKPSQINKREFFHVGRVLPTFQCVTVTFPSDTGQHWEVSVSTSLFLTIIDMIPPNFSRLESWSSLSLSSIWEILQLFNHLLVNWTCSSMFTSFHFSPLSLNATLTLAFLSPAPLLDSVSLFLTGYLSLLLPHSFFLSMFEFYQEFILTDLVPVLLDFLHVRIDNFF